MTREPNCITKVQNDHTKESWGWGSADLVSVERRGGPKAKAEGTAHRTAPQGKVGSHGAPVHTGRRLRGKSVLTVHRFTQDGASGESQFPWCTGSHRSAFQLIKSVPTVHRFHSSDTIIHVCWA